MKLDPLARDFRYACRALWRSPVFVSTSILVLALGIGAGLSLFQIVDIMLLEPLPLKAPTTLVQLHRHSPRLQSFRNGVAGSLRSPQAIAALRAE